MLCEIFEIARGVKNRQIELKLRHHSKNMSTFVYRM